MIIIILIIILTYLISRQIKIVFDEALKKK